MNEKEKLNVMIKNNLEWINDHLKKTAELKDKYRMEIEKLKKSPDYSDTYIQNAIEKRKIELSTMLDEQKNHFLKQTKELRSLIRMREREFDLSDLALSNALAIIQASGKNLSYENQLKINDQFRHNQNALSTIRDIYVANGINPVHIEKLLISTDSMIDHYERLSSQTFALDGNLNNLAREVNNFAKIEGVEISTTPDENGFINSLRKSVNLETTEI